MKYILTDDYEIYKVTEETTYRYECRLNKREIVSIPKQCIIKEGCTIEELCDEFVCGENHLLLKLYELKSEDFKEDVKDIVYGAIWTDKGLIYVAKMNEKGELELI